jgi:hypothetical protein
VNPQEDEKNKKRRKEKKKKTKQKTIFDGVVVVEVDARGVGSASRGFLGRPFGHRLVFI